MRYSLAEKQASAREALKEFIGRGRDLTQIELNQMSAAINNLLDEWRDQGDVVYQHGQPIDWVEFVRDEFNYNHVGLKFHVMGEATNEM